MDMFELLRLHYIKVSEKFISLQRRLVKVNGDSKKQMSEMKTSNLLI
jgi:hypothetical protein